MVEYAKAVFIRKDILDYTSEAVFRFIHRYLEIGGKVARVARVGENKNGIECDIVEVLWSGLLVVLLGKVSPGRRDAGAPGEGVLGRRCFLNPYASAAAQVAKPYSARA
ncbi:predicted protein [Histoplasma mississippiense (nom. inval.)]|uniref:predicted protein n=1 Tax=Ajellomyces capsulatus (strain NAm1 / WU24) TaxID=2059318 RepID=UPI000157B733|nr:predicted protein [Histoplasma mississippiense (nom. inval.)]EDN03661.1 predicted protein [Histoplasma mississippiense (nom. inval.)]